MGVHLPFPPVQATREFTTFVSPSLEDEHGREVVRLSMGRWVGHQGPSAGQSSSCLNMLPVPSPPPSVASVLTYASPVNSHPSV